MLADICNPGYKYGDSACESCGIGFYQPMKGQRFCFPCEVGSTTYGNNSVSEDDCVGKQESLISLKQVSF